MSDFRESHIPSPCADCKAPYYHGSILDIPARKQCGDSACQAVLELGITDQSDKQTLGQLVDNFRSDATVMLPDSDSLIFASCTFECAHCSPDSSVKVAFMGDCYKKVLDAVGTEGGTQISWNTGGRIPISFVLSHALVMTEPK